MRNPICFKLRYADERFSVDLDAIIAVTEMSTRKSCFIKVSGIEKELEIDEEYDVIMDRIGALRGIQS